MPRGFLRSTSTLALALLVSGCFSVRTSHRPSTGADRSTGGVALRVYADDTTRKHDQPGPRGLVVELDRLEGKSWEPVFRSLEPAWDVLGLPPGDYRVRFPARLDERGEEQPLDERPRKLHVRAGQVTEVEAMLEHVDKGLVVAGVVAAVVAAVLLDDWLGDHDLPLPPIPVPPPLDVADTIFWLSFDLANAAAEADEPWTAAGPAHAPVVTSHFPVDGATITADSVRVTFVLSEPLDAARVGDGCVVVEGEASGPVGGRTRYDADRWAVVWETDDDLERDDRFTVTLAADCVADGRGVPLAADAAFTFVTGD